jgi:hypothetical protein
MDNQNQQATPPLQNQTSIQTSQQASVTQTIQYHTSKIVIILLFLIFPPIAWYFMWKEKSYHIWFSSLLFLYAFFSVILTASMLFIVLPSIPTLYAGLNAETPDTQRYYPISIMVLVFCFFQAAFAIYTRKKTLQNQGLSNNLLALSILLLVVSYIVTSFGIGTLTSLIITPLYSMTAQFM